MDEMRMKQRQEPEVFYYDYATPLGMLRIEENGRGLTAVSPVKPECASCHTGAESLSGNGNGADIARCRMDETPLIRRAAAQLQEYFAGKRKVFDLPLAPEGTPFQHRVWGRVAFDSVRTNAHLRRSGCTGGQSESLAGRGYGQ